MGDHPVEIALCVCAGGAVLVSSSHHPVVNHPSLLLYNLGGKAPRLSLST